MNAHTLPLGLTMYLAQIAMVVLFTMGFVTYQNTAWKRVLTQTATNHRRLWMRAVVPLIATVLACLLFVVGNGRNMPQTGLTFNALAVFILAFLMFDEGISMLEFGVRGLFLFIVGATYYATDYTSPGFLIVVCFFAAWSAVIWRQRTQIRYHIWPHFLAIASISLVFWLTLPDTAVGFTFTPLVTLQALGFSIVATLVSGIYLHTVHQTALKDAAVRRNATIDALTGARTYAAYEHEVGQAFRLAQQNDTDLSIIQIDIDYFKAINDHYGHLAGNDILAGIAACLQETSAADTVPATLYRTGGEEFTLVCPANSHAALPLARACWQAVRSKSFYSSEFAITCTLSCGVAGMRAADTAIDDLFKRADENLYQSKQRGRDTITMMGQAVVNQRPERAFSTFTYFTQRVVDLDQSLAVMANTVMLAHYARDTDTWDLVKTPKPLSVKWDFMQEVAQMNPDERMSIFLRLDEFASREIALQLIAFMQGEFVPKLLWVNLRQLPTISMIQRIRPLYQQVDIRIIIEITDLKREAISLEALLPYVDGVSLTLAGLRAAFHDDDVEAEVAMIAWYRRCRENNTDVIFTEIENSVDAKYVTDVLHGHYVQGYAFDHPELPRLA